MGFPLQLLLHCAQLGKLPTCFCLEGLLLCLQSLLCYSPEAYSQDTLTGSYPWWPQLEQIPVHIGLSTACTFFAHSSLKEVQSSVLFGVKGSCMSQGLPAASCPAGKTLRCTAVHVHHMPSCGKDAPGGAVQCPVNVRGL